MRWRQPVKAVGKVFAHAEPQSTLARRLLVKADDIAHRPNRSRIPARLVLRVPHIVIVMVHAHADEVLGPGLHVQVHQMFRIPLVSLEQRDQVFVACFGGMPVGLEVVLVLGSPLDIHVPGEPVAVLDTRLRSPVRPDAELCVAEPVGNSVGIKRRTRRLKGSRSDGKRGRLTESAPGLSPGRRIAEQFKCVAPGKPHAELPPHSC